jgi:hypothetical protein
VIFCSGKRKRADGYETDNPTPRRYERLYDLGSDPAEFSDVSRQRPEVAREMKRVMLECFRTTHRDRDDEALEWYLQPRDV